MKTAVHVPILLRRVLHNLGRDINEARRRRRIPLSIMSERANISRSTLYKIERGDSKVSIGAYASVLFVLGLLDRLHSLVDSKHDTVGRELEADRLPKRIRISSSNDEEE